jgi:flagellin
MIELKGLSDDVMKNDSDSENYNREFKDLQEQIYDMASLKFNGVSMFAQFSSETANTEGKFGDLNLDNTVSIYVSAEGSAGTTVSVSKSMLLSALTIDAGTLAASEFSNAGTGNIRSFAAQDGTDTINLSDISVGVFTQAIENIATLRADIGASMSRLRFAGEEMAIQETNLSAAKGRITDVDIAAESTRMAKYNVLVQASASMLAQANSSADIALMLLR